MSGSSECVVLVLACVRLWCLVLKIFRSFSVFFVSSDCLVVFCSKLFSFVVSGALTCRRLQVAVFWIFF